MKTKRHFARETALQILYGYDVQYFTNQLPAPHAAQMALELEMYFKHFTVSPGVREFISGLVLGTLRCRDDLDLKIESFTPSWKLDRISTVDRNILRLAAFELLHQDEIPATVTLNEAVELAKEFGTRESYAFVNGILDSFNKKYVKKPTLPAADLTLTPLSVADTAPALH